MGVFMDRSSRHNDTGSPEEVGVGVKSTLVPINQGKVVMYARQLHIPVLTEHVVVACCYRVGAFLINGRR
jgi:hypothetical protein